LEKPIPLYQYLPFLHPDEEEKQSAVELPGQIETMKFCGIILLGVSTGCCLIAAWVIGRQNRKVTP